MNVKPALLITLDHHDLQKIKDRALDYIKNTSNPAIDSQLFPLSCLIRAFVEHVNKDDNYIQLTQPERLPYNCLDDE